MDNESWRLHNHNHIHEWNWRLCERTHVNVRVNCQILTGGNQNIWMDSCVFTSVVFCWKYSEIFPEWVRMPFTWILSTGYITEAARDIKDNFETSLGVRIYAKYPLKPCYYLYKALITSLTLSTRGFSMKYFRTIKCDLKPFNFSWGCL